jgi:hypothetical protein
MFDLLQQAVLEPDQDLIQQFILASYQLKQRSLRQSRRLRDLSQANRLKRIGEEKIRRSRVDTLQDGCLLRVLGCWNILLGLWAGH